MSGRMHRAAVVGTGKISEEHLRALAAIPEVEIAAVCDLSPSLAQYAAARFGARKAYTDLGAMLDEMRPHAVHVLTPAHTHVQIVGQCLERHAHVICEKPIAPTNAEFQRLWEEARQRGCWIVEDHNYRFNAPVLAIERWIEQGVLGEVREVDVRMALNIRAAGGRYGDANLPHPSHRLPAGVIHEFLTHMCYLVLRFVPSFERVAAAWRNHGGGELFRYDDLDALLTGSAGHARIRFSCRSLPEMFMLTVRGSKGWAETDLFQPYLRLSTSRVGGKLSPLVDHLANGWGLMRSSFAGFKNKVLQHTPYEGLHRFVRQTYEALGRGGEPPVGYNDMDRAARLIDALVDEGNRL